jgi:hypothetical protein
MFLKRYTLLAGLTIPATPLSKSHRSFTEKNSDRLPGLHLAPQVFPSRGLPANTRTAPQPDCSALAQVQTQPLATPEPKPLPATVVIRSGAWWPSAC